MDLMQVEREVIFFLFVSEGVDAGSEENLKKQKYHKQNEIILSGNSTHFIQTMLKSSDRARFPRWNDMLLPRVHWDRLVAEWAHLVLVNLHCVILVPHLKRRG